METIKSQQKMAAAVVNEISVWGLYLWTRIVIRHRKTLIFLFLLLGLRSQAQDLIMLRNGDEINGKVREVSENAIRYTLATDGDGLTRVLLAEKVFMIKYANGSRELIQQKSQVAPPPSQAPDDGVPESVPTGNASFGGPRVGATFITPGTMEDFLTANGKSPFITQFGWQFERRLFGFKGGPMGVFEFVPLLGGMEQGMFLPSLSTLVGLRGGGDAALEFALGPTLSRTGLALVFAGGFNLRHKNVNFPFTLAYVPSVKSVRSYSSSGNSSFSETGHRFSVLIGFNVRKR